MLEDLAPPVRVMPCAVRTLRDSLDEADRVILMKAMADIDQWPNRTLAEALRQRGVSISEKPIRKHRMGLCSCE